MYNALCLEKRCTYLNLKILYCLKKNTIIWAFRKLESFCWWQFLKVRQWWSLPHWWTFPFENWFSVACCLIAFDLQQKSFRTEVSPLKPCHCISTKYVSYSKFLIVISTIITAFSPWEDYIYRNHFLCSPIRSNSSSVKVFVMRFIHIQTPLWILSLVISCTSVVSSSTELLVFLKVIHKSWNQLLLKSY